MSNRIIPQSEEELERDKHMIEFFVHLKHSFNGNFKAPSEWAIETYTKLEEAHIKIEKLEEENKELKEELENSTKYKVL